MILEIIFLYTSKERVMENAVESQRSIVYFLWEEGTVPLKIFERLSSVFGEQAMFSTNND